ncbi:MAG TPA: polyprenyl synthetase family protein [Pseudonocardiaceae bacterium]|nr:polyprenyl synthetase family protein [Pseudonocardiaceae bacterium]
MAEPGTTDDNLPQRVESVLLGYFESRRKDAGRIESDFDSDFGAVDADLTGDFDAALDTLADFVLSGGKRLRPTFAWWGWRGAGGTPDSAEADAVLHAISALELVQACALMHDDLIDESAVRRGAPTVHVAFADRHRAQRLHGGPDRFGLAVAVLLGDLALAWADDMFAGAGLPADALARALPAWQAMRSEMLMGQYIDVLTQVRGDESPDAALRVSRFKTAAYTVERPLHIGAALAGADAGLIAAYRSYGANIGIAFQLRDDLLGVFGDPLVTGKPAGDDLRDGKRTMLMALGIQHARQRGQPADAELLRSCLGRADLGPADLDAVRALLVDLGAVAAVEHRIETLTEAGIGALETAPMPVSVAGRLADLAIAATRRDR